MVLRSERVIEREDAPAEPVDPLQCEDALAEPIDPLEREDALAEPVNPLEGEYTLTEPVIPYLVEAIDSTGSGPTALILERLLLEEAKKAELPMSRIRFFCLSNSGEAPALLP